MVQIPASIDYHATILFHKKIGRKKPRRWDKANTLKAYRTNGIAGGALFLAREAVNYMIGELSAVAEGD